MNIGREQRFAEVRQRSTSMVVGAWLALMVFAWTFAWILINAAGSRAWLVPPILLLVGAAGSTVAIGHFLATRALRHRIARMALMATVVLTVWSYGGVIVALVLNRQSFGQILSVVFFGTFVATAMGLVGYLGLFVLMWIGALFGSRGRHARSASSPSLTERPERRTPVR